MAVSLITTIHVYEGLSTDVKPISGIREGSKFTELDTGRISNLHHGIWKENISEPLSTAKAIELNAELRRLMEKTYLETRAANEANGIFVA